MKNVVARQHNGSVTHGSVPLGAMYDVHTGELISDFPANLNDLDRMEGEFWKERTTKLRTVWKLTWEIPWFFLGIVGQVDSLLRRLGETAHGREDARRRQLVAAVGVLHRAVEGPGRDRTRQRQR